MFRFDAEVLECLPTIRAMRRRRVVGAVELDEPVLAAALNRAFHVHKPSSPSGSGYFGRALVAELRDRGMVVSGGAPPFMQTAVRRTAEEQFVAILDGGWLTPAGREEDGRPKDYVLNQLGRTGALLIRDPQFTSADFWRDPNGIPPYIGEPEPRRTRAPRQAGASS